MSLWDELSGGQPLYFDRQGKPMTLMEWAVAFEDYPGRRIGATRLWNGAWVSTIWLGLNHGYGDGPPVIFESMVFAPLNRGNLDQYRYCTEEEARAGHERLVAYWRWRPHLVWSSTIRKAWDKTKTFFAGFRFLHWTRMVNGRVVIGWIGFHSKRLGDDSWMVTFGTFAVLWRSLMRRMEEWMAEKPPTDPGEAA